MTRRWLYRRESERRKRTQSASLSKTKKRNERGVELKTRENAAEVKEGTKGLFISVSGEPT